MISARAINYALATMGMIRFFPSDIEVKAKIGELIGKMCSTDEQVRWLADRMVELHGSQWPGPDELRATLCSKFKPKDGRELDSAVYLDGIPSEKPERNAQLTAGEQQKQITGSVTMDREAAAEFNEFLRTMKLKSERLAPKPMIAERQNGDNMVYRLTCECGEKSVITVPLSVSRFVCPGGCSAVYEHWQGVSGAYRAVCIGKPSEVAK